MARRSRSALEEAVARAKTRSAAADAHFNLAVFHDNNSREDAAISHYRAALKLGLAGKEKARAHAWLASSLYKTGRSHDAIRQIAKARQVGEDAELQKFLDGLEARVRRRTRRGGPQSGRKNG